MLSQIISKSCIMDYPEGSKEEKEKLNKCILKASVDTVFCLTYVVNCWIQYYAGPIVFWIYLLFQVLNTCTRMDSKHANIQVLNTCTRMDFKHAKFHTPF